MVWQKDKNGAARGTKRADIASAAALSLACLLVFAALQSPYRASAVEQLTKIIDKVAKNSTSVATKLQAQQQQYWQNFLKLEREAWHYNYAKIENQNVRAYQKWYCADLRLHDYKDFSRLCDVSSYPRDEMWRYEQLRDEILWNKANHQPHHEIKKTSEQLQYLQKRAEMMNSMIWHEKANSISWRQYLLFEKQAWHYDYALTERQNLHAFQKWWQRGTPPEMWFSEQYRYEILWEKTTTGVATENNHNDQDFHLQELQQRHDDSGIRSQMQSWFKQAYYNYEAEIAKNNCINPWERTPANSSPSWLACTEANGYSVSQSF